MKRPTLAISIGDAVDLEKLGFPAREVKRILFAICTTFVRSGYTILYGGDLRQGGYTNAMFEFLKGTYAGQGVMPFEYVVPATVSDNLDFACALALARDTRSVATIRLVRGNDSFEMRNSEDRLFVGEKGADRLAVADETQWQAFLQNHPSTDISKSLTDMRRYIATNAEGCISMGGKMGSIGVPSDQYEGEMPGVVEEALTFLTAGKPYVPLGAFGGATRDIAIALDLLRASDRTPRGKQIKGYEAVMDEIKSIAATVTVSQRPLLEAVAREENAEEAAQLALLIFQNNAPHSNQATMGHVE